MRIRKQARKQGHIGRVIAYHQQASADYLTKNEKRGILFVLAEIICGHPAFDAVSVAMAFAFVDHCSHLQTVGEIMSLMGDEAWPAKIMRSATKREIIANVLAGLN